MAKTRIASLDELPEARGVQIESGEHRIAVFRFGDEVLAIGDRCSHAEASLAEGEVWADDRTVECPRHGAEFELRTGEAISLPASAPVPVYGIEIEDGDVFVIIEEERS
jgi:3-phenylpropionate/trans-cinnamate dioxygenase ferredoxin subunit